jgi:hypothetical protein
MDLLVEPRNARQESRAHLRERFRDTERIGAEGDRVADVRAQQMHQAAEVVRQRQVEEHHVVRDRKALDVVHAGGHLVVVAVADHAGLGRPGRARGVDEGEELVLVDCRICLGQGPRVLGGEGAASRPHLLEVGERQHVAEVDAGDLRSLALILDEHANRVRVLQHVPAVPRGAVGVDRGANRADRSQRKVEERPLERRLREHSEGVALAHAERE